MNGNLRIHFIAGCVIAAIPLAGQVTTEWSYGQDAAAGANPFDAPAGGFGADEPRQSRTPPAGEIDPEALRDPLVRAIFQSAPSTPRAWFRSVVALIDSGHPELAERYLQKLTAAELDRSQLASLADELGSAAVMRLARSPALGEPARNLADAIFAAAAAELRDAARLDQAISELKDPSLEKRQTALARLRQSEQFAAAHVLSKLPGASPADAVVLRDALVGIGTASVGPLLGALEAPEPAVRANAAAALGGLKSRRAVLSLTAIYAADPHEVVRQVAADALEAIVGVRPTAEDAAAVLATSSRRLHAGYDPFRRADHQGEMVLWHWSREKKAVVRQAHLADEATTVQAAQLAAALYEIEPHEENRRWVLITGLEASKILGGADKPLTDQPGGILQRCAEFGWSTVADALRASLDSKRFLAAASAAEALGRIGEADELYRLDPERSTLIRAIESGDRRTQAAALGAIAKLNPQSPFAGISRVAPTLTDFVAAGTRRTALVAHERSDKGSNLAALIGQLGYEPIVVDSGKELIGAAIESGGADLILLSTGMRNFSSPELIYNLRRNISTRRTPIALLASPAALDRARRVARDEQSVAAFPAPLDPAGMTLVAGRLESLAGRNWLTEQERAALAVNALGWMEQLAAAPGDLYELRLYVDRVEPALWNPRLSVPAARVIGLLPTPAGQRSLVELASRLTLPIEARQAAAEAFSLSVQKAGILLSSAEILQQFDRYNNSQVADEASRQVLADILSVIESAGGKKRHSDEGETESAASASQSNR